MRKIKQEIEKYLKKHKYCVLCTCSSNDPRATSVRYEVGEDLTVIIYSENYTKKFNHLKKNKKDFSTELTLVKLVGKRRSFLKYIAKKDIVHYRELIKQLGIRK